MRLIFLTLNFGGMTRACIPTAFMRNPAVPTRLYVEMLAEYKDRVMIAFTDASGTHCFQDHHYS